MTALLPDVAPVATAVPRLVGDLGGTHLRLGLHDGATVRCSTVVRWADAPDLATAARSLLGGSGARTACLAVAGPVDGDRVVLTNASVAFSARALAGELGLDRLHVVNDLAALARSVPLLTGADALPLGGGPLDATRPVAVVAPGTGLGAAALVPTAGAPVVVSGEAGHVPLPATALGLDVARFLLERRGSVTAEDLVSGSGLPLLDVVVRELSGERDPQPRPAWAVTAEGSSPTLDVFVELLAAVTQACVLTLGARGGVVLGGGFLRGLVPLLRATGFAERVRTHARMGAYLADLPVVVDLRSAPALDGAALLLADLEAQS